MHSTQLAVFNKWQAGDSPFSKRVFLYGKKLTDETKRNSNTPKSKRSCLFRPLIILNINNKSEKYFQGNNQNISLLSCETIFLLFKYNKSLK
jgi:hypothetical protein